MLRVSIGYVHRLAVNGCKTGQTGFSLEFVRWRRKPRWVPIAKSKMFLVPERKQQSPEEKAELFRLNNNYKTQLRSVLQYLREEQQHLEKTFKGHIILTVEQEETEFQRCLEINEKWNKEIAAIRQERLEKERKEKEEYVKECLRLGKEYEEKHLENIEALVRKQKELSKTFITREKLENAIEQALANPVDFNFSIDLKGNIYRGRTNTPGNPSLRQKPEDRIEIQN